MDFFLVSQVRVEYFFGGKRMYRERVGVAALAVAFLRYGAARRGAITPNITLIKRAIIPLYV